MTIVEFPPFDPENPVLYLEQLHDLRRAVLRKLHAAKSRRDWKTIRAANAELERICDQIAFENIQCSSRPVFRLF